MNAHYSPRRERDRVDQEEAPIPVDDLQLGDLGPLEDDPCPEPLRFARHLEKGGPR